MPTHAPTPIRLTTAIALAAALALTACGGPKTKYGDAGSVETVTNQFGSTDLQMLAESMSQSMLSEAPVISSGNLPIVTVQEVKNKTSEYIDTRAITNRMRATLQKSRKVRFAADQADMQK
jgi:penicillin-binding protein activator